MAVPWVQNVCIGGKSVRIHYSHFTSDVEMCAVYAAAEISCVGFQSLFVLYFSFFCVCVIRLARKTFSPFSALFTRQPKKQKQKQIEK